ncbi:NAD(P)H-dependent amine dehydrogenase family protein [Novosphingobium soli]|uniref:Dihydrodipicolinate reductase n=1 Tax=Novosphingobium soli TaxID=574956 RepID=A0ABV6CX04_9SPHN
MDKLRVIQWTTGKVGKHALRAILDDPRLELAGCYAWSDAKKGHDAGSLCGRPDTGITATNDIEALIALGADTVLYNPFEADLDQVIRLLESGLDVVSTNLFLNLGRIRGEVKDRLEAACARGGSSLYITGINPGWINSVIASMTAICRDVRAVELTESADCSVYESVETWGFLGMGEPGGMTPELMDRAQSWLILFKDAVERIAAALDLALDDITFFCEYATAARDVDLGWMRMDKGTNAALRGGWQGKLKGQTVVTITVVWYLTRELAQGWSIDDDQYHLVVDGEPSIDNRIRLIPAAHWKNHDWDIMTALPAVSAVPQIKAARPGVLGLLDVGLPVAPVGAWRRARG